MHDFNTSTKINITLDPAYNEQLNSYECARYNGLFPPPDSDSDSDSDTDSCTMQVFPLVQIWTLIL